MKIKISKGVLFFLMCGMLTLGMMVGYLIGNEKVCQDGYQTGRRDSLKEYTVQAAKVQQRSQECEDFVSDVIKGKRNPNEY